MTKRRIAGLVALAVTIVAIGVAIPAALFTRLGVFAIGHQFWLARAASATTDKAIDDNLRRVLSPTQYGVNQAESFVSSLDYKPDRVRLWKRLIVLAPNENWEQIYQRRLQEDLGTDRPEQQSR